MQRRGTSIWELVLIAAILMILVALLMPVGYGDRRSAVKAASAQNNRQMALAGIMYGSDFDDRIPITINGELCRMQNIPDRHLTVNCPAPGTQDFPAANARGGQRADAWPLLEMPYIKSRRLFVNPALIDVHHIWESPAKDTTDPDYRPEGATYRNQDRFPFYGVNYMFLSPLRIPKQYRNLPDAVNYAVSESRSFDQATDPSNTIFLTESQHTMTDVTRGFFVVNAPGMWQAFKNNKDGYVAFWTGTPGSGDWVGTETACPDFRTPCAKPMKSSGFVYTGFKGGCNVSFLDGHVKYMKTEAIAAGTDYSTAIAGADGSGAKIIDKKKYLWNLDKNFYGL